MRELNCSVDSMCTVFDIFSKWIVECKAEEGEVVPREVGIKAACGQSYYYLLTAGRE
jgi:hypothetical protein